MISIYYFAVVWQWMSYWYHHRVTDCYQIFVSLNREQADNSCTVSQQFFFGDLYIRWIGKLFKKYYSASHRATSHWSSNKRLKSRCLGTLWQMCSSNKNGACQWGLGKPQTIWIVNQIENWAIRCGTFDSLSSNWYSFHLYYLMSESVIYDLYIKLSNHNHTHPYLILAKMYTGYCYTSNNIVCFYFLLLLHLSPPISRVPGRLL